MDNPKIVSLKESVFDFIEEVGIDTPHLYLKIYEEFLLPPKTCKILITEYKGEKL